LLDAIATLESVRNQVAGGGRQQQSFLEDRISPWIDMIDLLVSQKEYGEALTFAERSKARVLLDVLQTGGANLHKSLSPAERQAEEQQRLRLVSLNLQLTGELRREKPDQPRVTELKAGIEKPGWNSKRCKPASIWPILSSESIAAALRSSVRMSWQACCRRCRARCWSMSLRMTLPTFSL